MAEKTEKEEKKTLRSYSIINSVKSCKLKNITDEEKIAAIMGNWKNGDNCTSIADMSSFIPNSELMRKAAREGAMGQGLYDFQDGKDNGMKVPVARMKGADIAEISEAIKAEQGEMKEKVKSAQEKAEAEARAKASLEAYKKASQTHEEGK